jgi:hypothetical protein
MTRTQGDPQTIARGPRPPPGRFRVRRFRYTGKDPPTSEGHRRKKNKTGSTEAPQALRRVPAPFVYGECLCILRVYNPAHPLRLARFHRELYSRYAYQIAKESIFASLQCSCRSQSLKNLRVSDAGGSRRSYRNGRV